MPVIVENIGPPVDMASLGKWVKDATIRTAQAALREEVARGFDNQPVVVTDGVRRRAPEEVKPFGKIEFVASVDFAEIVRWTLTELQKRSPVLTGRYASSHVVMLNNAQIEGNIWQALRKAKPGDRVQIVNTQPYARKIEGATARKSTGRGARKGSSGQARGGVYRPVLRSMLQRWGKSIFVDFKYVKLDTGVKVWGDQGGRYYNRLKKDGGGTVKHKVKRVQRDQVYPAIQIFKAGIDRAN